MMAANKNKHTSETFVQRQRTDYSMSLQFTFSQNKTNGILTKMVKKTQPRSASHISAYSITSHTQIITSNLLLLE